MTFNAASFFAGIGTVMFLLAAGFGGGILMSGMLTDNTPREPSKIERRAAETAPPAVTTKPVAVAPAPKIQQTTPPPASEPQPAATITATASVPPTDTHAQPQPVAPV